MKNTVGSGRQRSFRTPFCSLAVVAALSMQLVACGGPPTVDPTLVGTWQLPVPGGRWVLTIDAEGHYDFASEGGAAASHSGELTAHNGEWTMHATSTALDDHGRYVVGAEGALQLTGNRGPIQWSPGAAAGAPTPAPVAAAATRPLPPPTVPPRAPAAQPVAARSSGATLPDTIDPCVLVTAAEAGELLGAAVSAERTTPQPQTQNDCLYRLQREDRSVRVTTYNGGGLDTAAWLARRRSQGGAAIDGVGDGGIFSYNTVLNISTASFVIGTASFEVLIGGVPRASAEPAARAFAVTMAKRVMSSSAAFQTPGLERLAGTWMATLKNDVHMVFAIERDGRLRLQTTGGWQGQMTVTGANWQITQAFDQPVGGTYAIAGDSLKIAGESLVANLTRVSCGKSPSQVQVPFDFTALISGRLNGKNLSAINPQADGQGSDARLAGLWEGEGTAKGRHVLVLASMDDRGRSLFALFPTLTGTIEASDGRYKMSLGGADNTSGTYRFLGGSSEGAVQMTDGNDTFNMTPYDPTKKRPYESPILGHCR